MADIFGGVKPAAIMKMKVIESMKNRKMNGEKQL